MARIGRYDNPYRVVDFHDEPPAGTSMEVLGLASEDHAYSHAVLWRPAGRPATTAFALMHPRADFLRHYLVPDLVRAGFAVLTQNSRWVGNDSMLIHERVLLDVAAGMRHLRQRGFERIIPIGNSGGGSLYTFYIAQAHAPAGARLTDTAAGDPLDLNAYDLPRVDGIAYVAAHPGEGHFLATAIDPSVVDESDPVACHSALDMYDPHNGFRPPPAETRYAPAFVEHYRAAQRARVERIDAEARRRVSARVAARARAKTRADAAAVRESVGVRFLTIYRTEADPRYVDLGLDPSERDYGSLFGPRPDVINYGPFGFGRVMTPEAWLSTWSANASRAAIDRHGGRVDVPALVIEYTADHCVFPSDTRLILDSLGTHDKSTHAVRADHYGGPAPGATAGGRGEAARTIIDWARAHAW